MASSEVPDCGETIRELHLFLDRELSAPAAAAVEHHLNGCPDCLGAFDFHAELKVVIASKCRNDELPPDLLARIEQCFAADLDGNGRIG